MPSIENIKSENKKFKKKEYRPWNIDGSELDDDVINANINNSAELKNTFSTSEDIISVTTDEILRWEHKDRPTNELGNIDELAETIKKIGQQVPCIVRKKENHYELIAGERRWLAAKKLGIQLKCIVRDIDDKHASFIQAIENERRKDLSDFAKGMSYHKKIEAGILEQRDLTDMLCLSRQQVSRLLSFGKLPEKLVEELKDLTKISSRTAEDLKRISLKSEKHLEALVSIADKISSREYGSKRIEKYVENYIHPKTKKSSVITEKVSTKNGRHVFTWRKDNNNSPSLHFPKDISNLLETGEIDRSTISDEIMTLLETHLENLKDRKN